MDKNALSSSEYLIGLSVEKIIVTSKCKSQTQYDEYNIKQREEKERKGCFSKYSSRQWKFLILNCLAITFSGMSYSLQAPFYPKLASSKGTPAAVYGFILGISELVKCILAPVYGVNVNKLGFKLMLIGGNGLMAMKEMMEILELCLHYSPLLRFLDRAKDGPAFISLSFILRIVESVGQTAFLTAVFAIVSEEFREQISIIFSVLQTLYTLGMIVGPVVGGVLYEAGGYLLPFAVTGILSLVSAGLTSLVTPTAAQSSKYNKGFIKLLKIPAIIICYYSSAAPAFSSGFLQALLQPHIEQFGFNESIKGLFFIINGVTYVPSVIISGLITSKGMNVYLLTAIGGLMQVAGFIALGPAPFIPLKGQVWLLILSLVVLGLGAGNQYVGVYSGSNEAACLNGFPDNIETYSLISALFSSSQAFGYFLGPTISGALYDYVGFENSTLLVVGIHVLVFIFNFGYYLFSVKRAERTKLEKEDLLSTIQYNKIMK